MVYRQSAEAVDGHDPQAATAEIAIVGSPVLSKIFKHTKGQCQEVLYLDDA